jgi:hypothetical protein
MKDAKTTPSGAQVPPVDFLMLCADFQTEAEHTPNAPEVAAAYDAFKAELVSQWRDLTRVHGIKVEAWTASGQPYANSAEMCADIRDNAHLYIFTGGDLPESHPLAPVAISTPRHAPDTCHALWTRADWKAYFGEWTYNEIFRAVHDYFGHYLSGFGFSARGEWNTALFHARRFSVAALPALMCETVFQSAFVNFGAHMRQATRAANGLERHALIPPASDFYLKPSARPYAEQKAFKVPEYFLDAFSDAQAGEVPADAYAARSIYVQRRAGAHECRGFNFCRACAWEFSESGKAALSVYSWELV